jgi:hypothetical protein
MSGTTTVALADIAEDATATTIQHRPLQADPLVKAMCMCTGPPARFGSVDPMLEEFALLVAARPMAAQAPGGRSTLGQASSWDPSSTAPQCTADNMTPMSLVLGMPSAPFTGTDSLTVEDSPSPGEAARRLAGFTEEIRVVRSPPLITSPPK